MVEHEMTLGEGLVRMLGVVGVAVGLVAVAAGLLWLLVAFLTARR